MRFFVLLALLAPSVVSAAVINAASPSRTDVGTAYTSASDGDTIAIPAGTATWSTALTVTKAIILQGNGVGSTIIKDGINVYGTPLINWTLANNWTSRITAIEFQDDGTLTANVPRFQFAGISTNTCQLRVDHCKFDRLEAGVFNLNTVLGVADHNVILAPASGVLVFVGYSINSAWGHPVGTPAWGDGAWFEDDNFGTDKFFFFEDNAITNFYATPLTMLDGHSGGRVVFRYNIVVGGSWEGHGAEGARSRSWRAWEIYNNTSIGIANTRGSPLYVRGGTGVIWSNTFSLWTTTPVFSLLDGRSLDPLFAPVGGSDGHNPWDKNNAGNPFVTGTCSSAGALTMTDNTKSWTANQWAGYTIRRTSGKAVTSLTRSGFSGSCTCTGHGLTTGDLITFIGANEYGYNNLFLATVTDADHFTFGFSVIGNLATTATGTIKMIKKSHFAQINSNTATQITFEDAASGPSYTCTFTAGDTYEINKVDQCMDQIGITGGRDLGGSDYPSIPGAWNDQTVSPWYSWNNIREDNTHVNFNNGYLGGTYSVIVSGTHYKNDTVKPGYTPYAYPHPLTGGDVTAPTLSSATIDAAGTSLTLVFSELVNIGSGGNVGWTPTLSGGAANVTYSSGAGTATLVYTVSRTVYSDETGTLAYTQPGNGIEDFSGNDLASLSGFTITNHSSQSRPAVGISNARTVISKTIRIP